MFSLTYFLINIIILVGAIYYWTTVEFDVYLFFTGPIGGACDLIALFFGYEAFARGPAGPALALMNLSALFFTIIEAIR